MKTNEKNIMKVNRPVAKLLWTVLLFLGLIWPSSVLASGFRIETQGARAMGMGNAFAAVADDLSAVYYNPAGLAGLDEPALYLGATVMLPSTIYENASGAKERTDSQVFLPPHLYAVYPVRNLAFAVGAYSPFGLGTKWSDTGLARYQATESELTTININPAIAVKVRPWLYLGAGINYMRSRAVMEKMVDQSLVGGIDAPFRLEGDGDGWGYNAGIIIVPGERLRLGASYRSAVSVDYSGSASLKNIAPAIQPLFGGVSFRTNAGTSIKFPDILTLGAAFRPSEKITLVLDLDRSGWSSHESFAVDLENEVAPAGFIDSTEAKDWKDVWAIKGGVEYRASERLSIRGGYAYHENPVPERTLDPGLPDSDQHDFSIGFGYRTGRLVIDAAYTAAYYVTRNVENSILSGRYRSFGHCLGLSAGYTF